MFKSLLVTCVVMAALLLSGTSSQASGPAVQGGLIVHLGCGDGRRTVELCDGDNTIVQGLGVDPINVEAAREYVQSQGLYGRVSIARFNGRTLPYIDNLVNCVVVDELVDVPMSEVMRILTPHGIAILGGETIIKPWPAGMDQWPQYLRGADNNAVSQDQNIGPPRRMQWVDHPGWGRSHMTLTSFTTIVSGDGRLLTIEDEASIEQPLLPGRYALVARDAFNGITLWRRPMPDWEPVTRYIKGLPVQLQRRLAAIDDAVYCTPGMEAPLTRFDAATGEVVRVYAGTERTQEFAHDEGVLYAIIGDRAPVGSYQSFRSGYESLAFRSGYQREILDVENPQCELRAVDADSGDTLWRKGARQLDGYVPCSLAACGDRVVYLTLTEVVCLDKTSGVIVWRITAPLDPRGGERLSQQIGVDPPTLVLTQEAVYVSTPQSVKAFAIDDGELLWRSEGSTNYFKGPDLFVRNGQVWTGRLIGYDALSGETVDQLEQLMDGPMSHDRCYRNFITEKYYINSKTGGADFIRFFDADPSLQGSAASNGRTSVSSGVGIKNVDAVEFPNPWVRGACGSGVLPANGMLYATPYSCSCSIGTMLNNLNALYADPENVNEQDQSVELESIYAIQPNTVIRPRTSAQQLQDASASNNVRLEKGPAYGLATQASTLMSSDDWPVYRHDGERSGVADGSGPDRLSPLWSTKLRTTPSAVIIAAGKVFVAEKDAHTVCALDAADGSVLWRFTAEGRIDSPPTFFNAIQPSTVMRPRTFAQSLQGASASIIDAIQPSRVMRPRTSAQALQGASASKNQGLLLFGSRDGWIYCITADDGQLVWRFKDLPDRMICAFGQVESAWPLFGSVLIRKDQRGEDVAYFTAGRSSFLDGGIVAYGLNPTSGELVYRQEMPSEVDENGFPIERENKNVQGFKNDVLLTAGDGIYCRHAAFGLDLTQQETGSVSTPHIICSAGFLDETPQHRTYWTIDTDAHYYFPSPYEPAWAEDTRPQGDILVQDGTDFYEVRGFPPARHSVLDSRSGYTLWAGSMERVPVALTRPNRFGKGSSVQNPSTGIVFNKRWGVTIPLTGNAMAKADDAIYIAGTPVALDNDTPEAYTDAYAGRLGGVLWAASAEDGRKLDSIELSAAPAWDGIAVAQGRLYIALEDGTIQCLGE